MSDAAPDGLGETHRLVVIAGSGRSGTSAIAGLLHQLGLLIPQPQVEGNRSNPRGFFEPRWVVDFQTGLLHCAAVRLTDARPEAFATTATFGAQPQVQAPLRSWLSSQFEQAYELVVKDPRNSWFLPMWQEAAHATGAVPGAVTMLRHPVGPPPDGRRHGALTPSISARRQVRVPD